MTRYTVSPPMLIERATLEDLLGQNEKYAEHLSSLQQIRMSDELVKWCEENKKVEIDEGEFEVRCVHGYNYKGDDCPQFAFPVEVVDEVWKEWDSVDDDFIKWFIKQEKPLYAMQISNWFFNYLKSKYKLTKI